MSLVTNVSQLRAAYDANAEVKEFAIKTEDVTLTAQVETGDPPHLITDTGQFAQLRAYYLKRALKTLIDANHAAIMNQAKALMESDLGEIKNSADLP